MSYSDNTEYMKLTGVDQKRYEAKDSGWSKICL